jgi:two-component system response regulator AtoC
MQAVERLVERVAATDVTVLVQGETGVGKEVVAKAIHARSPRAAAPWVKVNCAALPADLLESELFGHEKGAFTGAVARKPGKFELADRGTLFLDEVGEMPLALQAKLLHAVQDGELFRVGGREVIRADARLIVATNRDLAAMVARRTFREDLYYRLNVVTVSVPPLRERPEEIRPLAERFWDEFTRAYGVHDRLLPPEMLDLFTAYRWPGNVRELENLVKRLVVLGDVAEVRAEIEARLRTPGLPPVPPLAERPIKPPPALDVALGLRELTCRAIENAERAAIAEVLQRVHWNRVEAARVLKISYNTLLSKMKRAGFEPKRRPRAVPALTVDEAAGHRPDGVGG